MKYPSSIAEIVAYRGETDRAFALLDQAVAVKDGLASMSTEAQLISLHKDPRWLPFLQDQPRAGANGGDQVRVEVAGCGGGANHVRTVFLSGH